MRELVDARLQRIFRKLDEVSLGAPDDEQLTDEDVDLSRAEGRSARAFGVYTRKGLLTALRTYGTLQRLEERLGGGIELKLELEDPFRPHLVLWSVAHKAPAVDLTLSLCEGGAMGLTGPQRKMRLVFLEGIVLQNPGANFDWSRPPLPEQKHPGLAAAQEVLALLLLLTRRVGAEGLALVPSTFHAAQIYARLFKFVRGRDQGRLEAIEAAGRFVPRWILAWGAAVGGVRDARGRRFVFHPSPMVCPLTDELAAWFHRTSWQHQHTLAARSRFHLELKETLERVPWERFPRVPAPQPIARLLAEMLPSPPR